MQVRRIVNVLAVGFIVVGTTTACATKKFVRTEVEAVGTRVETLSQSLESTQEETRQNSAQIKQVDAKADQVGIWAKEAQTSATTANSAAAAAAARAEAVDVATKRLVYEVVISEDQGGFKFASSELPEAVQTRIDQMIAELKANPRGNYVEIEGHTDSVGTDVANLALSHRRAAAVATALSGAFGIPPENLAPQGYGEQYLKVNVEGPERENRRVAIRRITPLVAPVASAQ